MVRSFVVAAAAVGLLLSAARAEIIPLRGPQLTASFDTLTGRITALSLIGRAEPIVAAPGIELRTAQQVQVRFITGSWLAPADPSLTENPWRVLRRDAHRLTVESSLSPTLDLRTRQTIEIDPRKPALHIRSTLTRSSPNPFPVQAWLIVPAPLPDYFLLEVPPAWCHSRHAWIELSNPGAIDRSTVSRLPSAIRFSPPKDSQHPKVGTLGRWVAGIYRDIVLVLVTKPTSGGYPDGSSVQAYSAGPRAELETVSPNRHLRPGQRLVSESTLWIFPRDPATAPGDLPTWIDSQLKSHR